jgi:hypothetical protein
VKVSSVVVAILDIGVVCSCKSIVLQFEDFIHFIIWPYLQLKAVFALIFFNFLPERQI